MTEIIKNESELDRELERLLVEGDNENMAKTLLYILMYTVNNDPTYKNVKNIYINEAIDLLYLIDRIGFNDEKIIKNLYKLYITFFLYDKI